MTRNLAKIAKAACHTGAWLFAASDAFDEGRTVIYFEQRERQLRIAARRAYRAHALLSRLCARRCNVSPAVLARASDLHTRLHAAVRRLQPLAD